MVHLSCSRHNVSGTEGCSSFVRTGSAIWRNSRPRPGAHLPAVSLLMVLDMVCGVKGSLLGSQVHPMAVKPILPPKVEGGREGEVGGFVKARGTRGLAGHVYLKEGQRDGWTFNGQT